MPSLFKNIGKLLVDNLNEFLDENYLLNSNYSEFQSNDSSIYQLIAIMHGIFTAFDAYPFLVVHGAFKGEGVQ